MTKIFEKIEKISVMALEHSLDVPTDIVIGVQAYHDLQKESSMNARYTNGYPQPNGISRIAALYTSFGILNIRVDTSVKPDHISLGIYTSEQAAFISTLHRLDILGSGFHSLS